MTAEIPQEVLFHIYEFLLGPEYYVINRAAYSKYQKWKLKIIDEFREGICTKQSCGHKNTKMRLIWNEITDWYNGEAIWSHHSTKLCMFCFAVGIDKFIKEYIRLPIYTRDGIKLYNIISNPYFRCVPTDQFFGYIESQEYKEISKIKFHENNFIILDSFGEQNKNYFKFHILKYEIYKTKELVKLTENSIKNSSSFLEHCKTELAKLEEQLKNAKVDDELNITQIINLIVRLFA